MASDNQYTFVQLCNATGCTLIYTGQIDWHGGIGPAPYPQSIANGEQGWFLHVRSASQPGSEGAVCYRGVDVNRTEFIWIVYWINPFNSQNKVFAVVLPSSSNVDWDRIRQEIAGTDSTNGDFTGYFTHASIDIDGNFPTAKAVVTKNANN
ncbi:23 kDa jasmonate-induced protein-like [Ziziphus jujuba]|uniref:23 kDa jasmonate-induced protein-like n=1 Tax=Ziziphus jujuba TaxID=326968 RepID=A0A6P4A6F0_ZIZJJ|nr:23 kDa jasmonate-induced protein-like [Ziziphus jujuba]